MAQDYNTMTPGSGVAEAIQAILQRRRDESRQAMLDKLMHDKTQADMAAQTRTLEQGDRRIGLDAERNAFEGRRVASDEAKTAEDIITSQIGSMGDVEQ